MSKDIIVHYVPEEIGTVAFRKVSLVDKLDWSKAILLQGKASRRTRKVDSVADWITREHGSAVFNIEKKLYRIRYSYEAFPNTDGYIIHSVHEINKAQYSTVIASLKSRGEGKCEWDTPYLEDCNIVNLKEGFTTKIENYSEHENITSKSYVYWRENYDMKHIPIPAPDMF